MIWAILISSILLLTLNLVYLLLKKRTDARKALDRLSQPLRRREMLLERLSRRSGLQGLRVASHGPLVRPESTNDYEQVVARENAIHYEVERIDHDLTEGLAGPFRQEAEIIQQSWKGVRDEWEQAAREYNARAKAYNRVLGDFPGRFLATFLQMRNMPSLKV